MVINMKIDGSSASFQNCLLQSGVYRGSQGRLIRCLMFIFLVSCIFVASQQVYSFVYRSFGFISGMSVACVVVAAIAWFAYRLIQYQPVADFLIDVQQESLKVTWCTWQELRRTTEIVLAAMVVFSLYLFVCDVSWQFLLRSLSVLSI